MAEIADFLNQAAGLGLFDYVLPFLLVFAIVFGILSALKIFKDNKMINAIIALSVGLLSLQYDFVREFSASVFPRFGVGIIILLIVLILIGLFLDPAKPAYQYALLIGAVIIAGTVLVKSADDLGWTAGDWWVENWGGIAIAIFIVVILAVTIAYGGNKQSEPNSIWSQIFSGEKK